MDKYNCCTYGADSKVGYFTFGTIANIDIDDEADFEFAETVMQYLKQPKNTKIEYFNEDNKSNQI